MSNFIKTTDYTLQNEGGFTNNPADTGGPTNWGITQTTFERFLRDEVTVSQMKAMTRDDALAVYKSLYWSPLGLDGIVDDDVATAIFDVAVNRGPHPAIRYAQEASKIPVDGLMGPLTAEAINKISKNNFLVRFTTLVQASYIELVDASPARVVFLAGWSARAMRLLTLMEGVVL